MNMLNVEQTDKGFKLNCNLDQLPIDLVEELLNQTACIVREQFLKEASSMIPEDTKDTILFLNRQAKHYRRLNFFWYALSLVFLGLYILK